MKRLLFLLLFIPAFALGQSALVQGQDVFTYNGKALTYTAPSYCDEYQAIYDAYTTKPSDAVADIDNTMVAGLVSDGVWVKLDIAYLYAAHTNDDGEALINIINPGTFDATAYLAPTFTAYQGFLGNGTTQYINTGGWVPSVNGMNFTQNSASQIIYVRTNINSTGQHGTTANDDGRDLRIIPKFSTNNAYIRTNDATSVSDANTDGSGMFVNTRTAAAVNKLYRNKVVIIDETSVSTGAPTHTPLCLAYNDDNIPTGFRADQVSFYAFGSGLTQTDVNNITDRFETRMDALGTGVIP